MENLPQNKVGLPIVIIYPIDYEFLWILLQKY